MAQRIKPFVERIKPFLSSNGPMLTAIVIFILIYVMGGQLYPNMQKPQVFFNLFINAASLLIVSIGMTFRDHYQRDRSVRGRHDRPDLRRHSLFIGTWCKSLHCHALDVSHGNCFWVYLGMYHPFLESGTLYRDLDGPLFRTRDGLCHHP